MATKKQIAEQGMRILAGGHLKPDRNLDIREVMLVLDQLRDAQVEYDFYQSIKDGDYTLDTDYLSYHENVSVVTDANKKLRYIVLPSSPISLPHDMGLYQISPMQNQENVFHRMPPGALGIYRGKQSLENEDNTYYWTVGERVYFKNIDAGVEDLLLLMAKSSKDILESEDYPMPPNKEALILQQLKEVFLVPKQIPHDELEDGQK